MNDLKGIIEDCNKSDLVSDKVIKKVIEIIGQEEWQVLHDENNNVCTTMGELIITLEGIADLEKENAELKHIIATLRQEKDNVSMHAKAMEVVAKTRSDQLIKAKELLKKFMKFYERTARECYSKDFQKTLADTEQFISEVEK